MRAEIKNQNIFSVYSLNDPCSGLIKYIGVTSMPIKRRLYQHVYYSEKTSVSSKKSQWIKYLKPEVPTINILEDGLNLKNGLLREREYIKLIRSCGAVLTNETMGGYGMPGYIPSKETIKKIKESRKGYVASEETRKKLALACKRRVITPEFRAKMSRIRKGSVISDKQRKDISETLKKRFADKNNHPNFGRKNSEEHKLKMSLGRKNNKPILQYDLNGNMIHEWRSIRLAARELYLGSRNISTSCKNKNGTKTCGGFIWKYKITST